MGWVGSGHRKCTHGQLCGKITDADKALNPQHMGAIWQTSRSRSGLIRKCRFEYWILDHFRLTFRHWWSLRCPSDLVETVLCVVDAVSSFWQNHSTEFPSLSVLQSCITDLRRRSTVHSSADVNEASAAAAQQRDVSSADSDKTDWLACDSKLYVIAVCDSCELSCSPCTISRQRSLFISAVEFSSRHVLWNVSLTCIFILGLLSDCKLIVARYKVFLQCFVVYFQTTNYHGDDKDTCWLSWHGVAYTLSRIYLISSSSALLHFTYQI